METGENILHIFFSTFVAIGRGRGAPKELSEACTMASISPNPLVGVDLAKSGVLLVAVFGRGLAWWLIDAECVERKFGIACVLPRVSDRRSTSKFEPCPVSCRTVVLGDQSVYYAPGENHRFSSDRRDRTSTWGRCHFHVGRWKASIVPRAEVVGHRS